MQLFNFLVWKLYHVRTLTQYDRCAKNKDTSGKRYAIHSNRSLMFTKETSSWFSYTDACSRPSMKAKCQIRQLGKIHNSAHSCQSKMRSCWAPTLIPVKCWIKWRDLFVTRAQQQQILQTRSTTVASRHCTLQITRSSCITTYVERY